MSTDADIEGFVDALRQDGPSGRDAARMQARLAALGVVTGASIAKAAVASTMPAGKVVAGLATRWASLSLLPKIGVITAVSATALAGAVAVHQHTEAPPDAPTSERNVAAPSATPAVQRDRVSATAPSTGLTAHDDVAAAPQPAARDDVIARRSAMRTPQLDAPQAAAKSGTAAARPVSREAAPAAETATASFDRAASSAAAPAPTSTLPEETALIDAAFAALRAGDTTTASVLVAEHARRFPNGLLSRERQHALERLSKTSAAAPLR